MINAISFAAQAAQNPTRFYKRPDQVVRDRRLARAEKLAVLEAWEMEARSLAVASEESMNGGERDLLQEVVQARVELGETSDPGEESGAPTKAGVRKVPEHE